MLPLLVIHYGFLSLLPLWRQMVPYVICLFVYLYICQFIFSLFFFLYSVSFFKIIIEHWFILLLKNVCIYGATFDVLCIALLCASRRYSLYQSFNLFIWHLSYLFRLTSGGCLHCVNVIWKGREKYCNEQRERSQLRLFEEVKFEL